MSKLLDFFAGATARIQALLYGAIALVALVASLSCWALWERSRVYQARDETDKVKQQLVAEIDQGKVLADKLAACNAGVELVAKTAAAALEAARESLELARKLGAQHAATAQRIEDLLKKPPPAGAGCREARAAIAADRAAKKAGAAP